MAKEYQSIRFNIDDRVARITFARPLLNVFNIAMMREIGDALNECVSRHDLAAIVFDAADGTRAFSAGVAVEEHLPETIFQMLDSFHSIFRTLAQISKPTIAVVDGAALGLGGRSGFESVLTEVENLYLNELMKTEDASEGVHAFMEKRKPEWRNK